MSDIAIKIENVSKLYRLGVYGARTLREDLQRRWWRLRGKGDPLAKIDAENSLENTDNKSYVWALRNINIEVPQGQILGIIGKNGAGKSTLLKLLSRVTLPTEGQIKIKGRIGSLLEVGTGFHPELTGRENIYLNGAILGMTRSEINKKFDDIVDFAGVAKYIDTPVKRYSSGMRVRLGFAVAAFLEPEILVVDEVLAVGDAEFQKRAIGKMQDVSRGDGRTVLFVSHNMASIKNLCDRAVLLEKGKLLYDNSPTETIRFYINQNKTLSFIERSLKSDMYVKKLFLSNNSDDVKSNFGFNEQIIVNIDIESKKFHSGAVLTLFLYTNDEFLIFASHHTLLKKDKHLKAYLPKNLLLPGNYLLQTKIHVPNNYFIDNMNSYVSLTIENTENEHNNYMKNFGIIKSNVKWISNDEISA